MRATIIAGRVLATVLLLWAVVCAAWTVRTIFYHPAFDDWGQKHRHILTDEVFFHHFSIPLLSAGLAVGLLLLASILDELRRRPK
jgi:hypothetical protein